MERTLDELIRVKRVARKLAISSTGPLSGKSTLAKHLEKEYGFVRVNHALTLVEDFVETYNIGAVAKITVEDVYADKECWRPMLQAHGYWAGFHNPELAGMWVMRTLAPWLSDQSRDVVFEPIRSEEQAEVLRDMGFTLVQLDIPGVERCKRARALGLDCDQIQASVDLHPELERGIAKPVITILFSLPVDTLARMVLRDMGLVVH